MPTNIQGVYQEGAQIEVEVLVTTHHKGHFVFSICPIIASSESSDSAMPIPTKECFARNKLTFLSDELYGAPPDPNYPERAYIAPATVPEWSNGLPGEQSVVGATYKMKLQLPMGVAGEVVLLQWYYLTANSCKHDGYEQYPWPQSWEMDDPTLDNSLPDCGELPEDGNGYPEQFWNCAEIKIVGSPTVTPTAATTEKPTAKVMYEIVETEPDIVSVQTPTKQPTRKPQKLRTLRPSTERPTNGPTMKPSTERPTNRPTKQPITERPTNTPTTKPSTGRPTSQPTRKPQTLLTPRPTKPITGRPTRQPSRHPVITNAPTEKPTVKPTAKIMYEIIETEPNIISIQTPTKKPTKKLQTPRPTRPPTGGNSMALSLQNQINKGQEVQAPKQSETLTMTKKEQKQAKRAKKQAKREKRQAKRLKQYAKKMEAGKLGV